MQASLRSSLRCAQWLAACAAALLLAGCGMLIPQTVDLRTAWPESVPRQAELARVPFFPQDDYQCGPAALAMAMVHAGAPVRPETLVEEVWVPSRHGSLQVEMLAAPRRHGLVSYRLAPHYADLLREVAAGNPVIVLQDVGMFLPEWHYAVVNGYDYATGTVYLRSGLQMRQAMPFSYFERTWLAGRYWAMVVLPPGRIAATATEERWLDALLGLARGRDADASVRGYRAALARWPDSLPAAVGLANHLHAQNALDEAAAVLRMALQRHPDSVILMNNLAQTLSDQGRNGEALALIHRADAAQSPFGSEVRATRELIEERLRAAGS
ncbi:PA2778 family cysteine peptidase [Ramlibacter sp. USB13]|uniref:PA2778 family cysteine peptidase n=1 Tax=Ramlibacter cellulosilyticus TaxID=2764187 RepID=A0A923MN45_9BURK|nr:PA2778 family cysteine peptidase [Ramlibacter cellulosilyticus]MBC5782085.1 PA2778 family cysteine peptidase [Ramlibacter cellulosilyticus]